MKGDNRHKSYACGKCAHVLNRRDRALDHFCKKHGGDKGSVVVGIDIIPIVKDVSTPARVVEVAEVTGVDVSARQATNGETEAEEMESPVVEIQRPQVEGRDLEDIIRIRVEKEVKRRMAEKEPRRVEGNSEILGQAVKAVGDCLLMQTEARFTREALTSIKSQSVTSSMNIGRLNAKTSQLGESVERVEQKCDNIAAKVNNLQSIRDVSQVMMTCC